MIGRLKAQRGPGKGINFFSLNCRLKAKKYFELTKLIRHKKPRFQLVMEVNKATADWQLGFGKIFQLRLLMRRKKRQEQCEQVTRWLISDLWRGVSWSGKKEPGTQQTQRIGCLCCCSHLLSRSVNDFSLWPDGFDNLFTVWIGNICNFYNFQIANLTHFLSLSAAGSSSAHKIHTTEC